MFGSTVSIPLLFGPAMGMSLEQIGVLISSVMLCSGVATLVQVTFGSRLPIVQGVSFSFIAAFFFIIFTVKEDGGSPAEMMRYIYVERGAEQARPGAGEDQLSSQSISSASMPLAGSSSSQPRWPAEFREIWRPSSIPPTGAASRVKVASSPA